LKTAKVATSADMMRLDEAMEVLRAVEVTRPWAAFELTIKTYLPRGSAIPQGRITFPRQPKPKTKEGQIVVFADGKKAEEAKQAGASVVGGLELVEQILSGKIKASTYLSTPAFISQVQRQLGRFLGPQGLMPSERRGTVTENIVGYLRNIDTSQQWKADKHGTIRTPVGKLSFPNADVKQNVKHFVEVVSNPSGKKPTTSVGGGGSSRSNIGGSKATITKVILSSTQGPSIQLSDVV